MSQQQMQCFQRRDGRQLESPSRQDLTHLHLERRKLHLTWFSFSALQLVIAIPTKDYSLWIIYFKRVYEKLSYFYSR